MATWETGTWALEDIPNMLAYPINSRISELHLYQHDTPMYAPRLIALFAGNLMSSKTLLFAPSTLNGPHTLCVIVHLHI